MTNDPPEAVLPPPKAGEQAKEYSLIWPGYKDLTPGPSPAEERGENSFVHLVAINRSSVESLSLLWNNRNSGEQGTDIWICVY